MKRSFDTEDQVQVVLKELKKAIGSKIKSLVEQRKAAEGRLEILLTRVKEFGERVEVAEKEIVKAKGKISETLAAGGDPTSLNRDLRMKHLDLEDLKTWISEIESKGIPDAKKEITAVEDKMWEALVECVGEIKPHYESELNDILQRAAEVFYSWPPAVRSLLSDFGINKPVGRAKSWLNIDPTRSNFGIYER